MTTPHSSTFTHTQPFLTTSSQVFLWTTTHMRPAGLGKPTIQNMWIKPGKPLWIPGCSSLHSLGRTEPALNGTPGLCGQLQQIMLALPSNPMGSPGNKHTTYRPGPATEHTHAPTRKQLATRHNALNQTNKPRPQTHLGQTHCGYR